MQAALPSRAIASLTCAALIAAPLSVRAEQTIRCESSDFRYRYCRVDTDNRVELTRKHSSSDCREDRSWGYDRHGVWVDRGCAADFRVGKDRKWDRDWDRDRKRDKDKDHDGAVAAGVGLVGLAALVAVAASSSKDEPGKSDGVASWAVGSFNGYDEVERAQVQVSILPGGSASGRAGSHEFTGSFKDNRLQAGRHTFRVERSGNGFIATDESDAGHRVVFQRGSSGY